MSPLVTAPNLIEQSDYSAGWCPDLEPASVPENGLLRVNNLLPDVATGQPQVREGFTALDSLSLSGRTVRTIHTYALDSGTTYLILVSTADAAGSNNVKVHAWNLTTGAWFGTDGVISLASKTFANAGGRHYGFTVDDKFYGGNIGDTMYSWTPTGGWVDDASSPGTFAAFLPNKAYKKGDSVLYSSKNYSCTRTIKEESWDNTVSSSYSKGQKVSWKAGGAYWMSFKCVKKHTLKTSTKPTVAGSEPGAGTYWREYWQRVKVDAPLDDDGETTRDWQEIPAAPKTNMAVWHGNRMFGIDEDHPDRVLFSRQAKVTDVDEGAVWDPTDWRVTGSSGAGWQFFKTEDGQRLKSLYPFGFYLLAFKKQTVHVIAGVNPETWNPRKLAPVGIVGRKAVTEHDGVVYFVGDRGFYMTDGTTVEEVKGAEKVRDWLRLAIARNVAIKDVTLFSFRGFVWLSLPTSDSGKPDKCLVYDPSTESFWKQSLSIQDVAIAQKNGMDQLYFTKPTEIGTLISAAYAWTNGQFVSTSTRTISGTTLTNYFKNPSFERTAGGLPTWINHTVEEFFWTDTHAKVTTSRTTAAARRGKLGAEVSNKHASNYEGVKQSVTLPVTNYKLAFKVRRPHWATTPAPPDIKMKVGVAETAPTSLTDLGNGWWNASISVTGIGTPVELGILVAPGLTIHVDQAQIINSASLVPYFDGEGGDQSDDTSIVGGDVSKVYQFGGTTDDGAEIAWGLRTSWFPFGTLREDRRIRRVWALIRGSTRTVLRTYINYRDNHERETDQVQSSDDPATFYEGAVSVLQGYSVSFDVEGLAGPAAVLGVAADTQPLRIRYGV